MSQPPRDRARPRDRADRPDRANRPDQPRARATTRDRSLTWLPLAGAAVLAVIVVGTVLLVGGSKSQQQGLQTDDNGALKCEKNYLQRPATAARAWVPIKATGVDGKPRLVPNTEPEQVTICHYPARAAGRRTVDVPVEGHKVLRKGLTQITKTLSQYPAASTVRPACHPPGDTFIVGFVFATGVVWVTVPDDGCHATTNGTYSTDADLRPAVQRAYATGTWG